MLRLFSLLIIFLGFSQNSIAQFCTGTLGDNIFIEGDFGAGFANLLSPNPNIAPGYNYTFNVPPIDGQYIITNNTGAWSGLFDTWLNIRDNSFDPNGYMMVINASHEPGLFYEQTVTGLCENTLYEFSADIINLILAGTPNHLDPNVSFLLDGVQVFSTGDIPKTNNWISYGFTFFTQPGQQSLTLSLRNNAPGGIGNDLAIDNISFRPCGPEIMLLPNPGITHLCEGDEPIELQTSLIGEQYVNPAFQWQESFDEGLSWVDIDGEIEDTYTHPPLAAGVYYYRFMVADGNDNLNSENCLINSNIKIIIVHAPQFSQKDTIICDGQEIFVANSIYTEEGVYLDTLPDFFGCDSIIITNLTVTENLNLMADFSTTPACPNQPNGSISIINITGGTPPLTSFIDGAESGMTTVFNDLTGGETYNIILKDDHECFVELSTIIETHPDLTADLIVTPSCPEQETGTISIENIIGGLAPFSYVFEGVDVDTTRFFSNLPSGAPYSIIIQDGNGCSFEESAFIIEQPELFADLLVNPPCPNEANASISLENIGGGTAPYQFSFEGMDVGNNTLFEGLAGGETYIFGIQDGNGCSLEQSIFVDLTEDLGIELTVNPPCPNQTNGNITIENIVGGTPPYKIAFEGIDAEETIFFENLSGGITYSIVVEDDIGCLFEETVFIEQPPNLVFELGQNQTVELGETVRISPFYNFIPSDFEWEINLPIDCNDFENCDDLSFIPIADQQVTLELFGSPGCSLSDSLFIEVLDVRNVYIPNAFSPNGDGVNDAFTVFARIPNVQMVEELQIFNRWGALVYENKEFLPNNEQLGWNGTFQGEPLDIGVYVYVAQIRFVDEEVLLYTGDVSIIK